MNHAVTCTRNIQHSNLFSVLSENELQSDSHHGTIFERAAACDIIKWLLSPATTPPETAQAPFREHNHHSALLLNHIESFRIHNTIPALKPNRNAQRGGRPTASQSHCASSSRCLHLTKVIIGCRRRAIVAATRARQASNRGSGM